MILHIMLPAGARAASVRAPDKEVVMSNNLPVSVDIQSEGTGLKKSLNPAQVWALALGSILGWGAFVLPALRFLPEAGPGAATIGFAIGGLMLLFVAKSYGHMISQYPVAGGAFAFAYAGFGPTVAFACGWALALGYLCIIALNGTALILLTRFLMPGVLEFGYMYSIAGWAVYFGEIAMVVSILCLGGYLNYKGADIVGKIQVFLAFALCFGVVALFLGSTTTESASVANLQPLFAENKSMIASILAIVAIAPWLYVGFDTIPQAAEEFNFPHEKAVRLMTAAIIGGAVLYSLVTIAVAIVMPYKELLVMDVPWATGTIATIALGQFGSILLAIVVMAAIFTGINGFFIAASRLLFSMGRAKVLPGWFAAIHPKHKTPHNAVLFTLGIVVIAPFFGREVLNWVVDMSAVGTVTAYMFTCMTAYKSMSAVQTGPGKDRIYAVLGTVSAIICIGLLTIPGSPGAITLPSWAALIVWAIAGFWFYRIKVADFSSMKTADLSAQILGCNKRLVFFKGSA